LKFPSRGSIISAHSANPGGGVYSVKISAVPGFLFFKNPKKLSGYTLLKQAGGKSGGFAQNAARPGNFPAKQGLTKKTHGRVKEKPGSREKARYGKK
jgi:hypothetical protein